MKNLMKFIFSHKAFSLTVLNLLLMFGVLFQKDPFGLFLKTYDTAPKFFSLKQEEISRLSLIRDENPDSKNIFTRESGVWKVEIKGKTFLADEEKFSAFLKALLDARRFTLISDDESKFSELGTKGREAFIVEIFAGENSKGRLTIGNLASGGFTYVRWNEGKEVYLVEDNLKTPMGRGAFDFFINKKLSEKVYNSEEVASIKLNNFAEEKKSYLLLKKGEAWESEEPIATPLKKEEVTSLVGTLANLAADEVLFEEPPVDLSEKGKYEIIYSFQSADKGGESVSLQILGKDKSDSYLFRKNNQPVIYKVNQSRFKSILDFDIKKAKVE